MIYLTASTKHDLSLSVEDLKLLLSAISTLCTLQAKMESNDVTLQKLRKLLGMVKQSEKRRGQEADQVSASDKKKQSKKKKSPSNKKRNPKRSIAKVLHHKITDHRAGEVCSACQIGKLYKFKPAKLLRVTGHARFEAAQHDEGSVSCETAEA